VNSHSFLLLVLAALPLAAQPVDDAMAKPFVKFVDGFQGCTTFAPDGKTVYFITLRGEKRITTIMEGHLQDGKWTAAIAPFSGVYSDGDPALSPDGSRLVFWSRRPDEEKPKEGWWPDLWYVKRTGETWSEPRHVPGTLRTGGPSIAADGTLYFFKVTDDKGKQTRLVRARPDKGGYGQIEDLGETVNGAYGGLDPVIAPDQSYIIFSSRRPDSIGDGDFYISHRKPDGWTEPRNLGPNVNSKSGEYCPSLSPDGKVFYFTRGEEGVFYAPLPGLLKK